MADPRPTFSSALSYLDPKAALRWLETAFGFEPAMVISDAEGNLLHAEMTFGGGLIMLGAEWSDETRSPRSVGGKVTQSVHVHLTDSVDAHCRRAREAGAEIIAEPSDQFYGDRTYRARDPEGHIWTFAQTVHEMTPAEWDEAGGVVTTTRL